MAKMTMKKETKGIVAGAMKKDVSEDELEIAFSGPAIAANRVFVSTNQSGIRLAFAEQSSKGSPVFRNAVFLGYEQAISLKNILAGMLKEIEEKIAKDTEKEDG